MNEMMRDSYIEDCQRGVDKWNKAIASHGIAFELKLPSRRFHRHIGVNATTWTDPAGNLVSEADWKAREGGWLPSAADRVFVKGLVQSAVTDPRQMASWVSAPKQGIKGRPIDFEYVRRDVA
jgi:benzoyl-CoA 2,3-dioxygenase component B